MDETLPTQNTIFVRKSAFGRTDLFLKTPDVMFKEIKCMSSIIRHSTSSIFHIHQTTNNDKTNINCWHCCHRFDTEPLKIPRVYDSLEKKYHIYGCFCSPACAKTYIVENTTFDKAQHMNVFIRMLREIYGITESIVQAPPRVSLNIFGGPYDIETFRTKTNMCNIITPPFVSYCMIVEEQKRSEEVGVSFNKQIQSVRGIGKIEIPPESSEDIYKDENGLYHTYLKENDKTEHVSKKTKKEIEKSNGTLAQFMN